LDKKEWPVWWGWELELSSHLLKRMADRGFTEVDLRSMLVDAMGHRVDIVPARWVISTRHRGRLWEIIVEPDVRARILVVVTAYFMERRAR